MKILNVSAYRVEKLEKIGLTCRNVVKKNKHKHLQNVKIFAYLYRDFGRLNIKPLHRLKVFKSRHLMANIIN